jgi:hypothetical protein
MLKCEEPSYYKLTDFLYTSNNEQAIVLKALYEYNINVVLKFGINEYIEKEYDICNKLLKLPNFIKYFCMIKCNDNIKNIINNKDTISNYKMCHYGDKKISILVMKHYYLGCLDNYDWNENNFDILKNVIKQVIFAIIYAFDTFGFIHGDLHSGNILLKPKRNDIINYGKKILFVDNLEAIIMDFEKSKLNQYNKISDLIRNIDKLFTSIINSNNMTLNINYDRNKLISLKTSLTIRTFFDELDKIIENMTFDI